MDFWMQANRTRFAAQRIETFNQFSCAHERLVLKDKVLTFVTY